MTRGLVSPTYAATTSLNDGRPGRLLRVTVRRRRHGSGGRRPTWDTVWNLGEGELVRGRVYPSP